VSDPRQAARLALLQIVGRGLAARASRRPAIGASALSMGSTGATPAEAQAPMRAPRILLIRPDHLGDVLLASPAAEVLRAALPEAKITWLVGPWTADIAARAGGPAEVDTVEFPGFTRRPKSSPIEPYHLLLKEAARLRAAQFDAALVLRPDHWWGALLVAAAGIPRRFGYAVAECRPFLTDTLPPPTGHVVEANQELARLAATALGGYPSADMLPPTYPVSADDAAWASALAPAGKPLIAVHPGSGAAIKSWPTRHWVSLIQELRHEHDAEIVLTGGPGERDLVGQIAAALDPQPRQLAGETSLGQLAALFAACDLVIGGDSGPLHLAAAVGTPTVRLYGPTDIAEFGPWPRTDQHIALAADLPCQPCRNLAAPPCGATEFPACLRALSPDTVVAATSQQLRATTRSPHPPLSSPAHRERGSSNRSATAC
jgi:lipopolysaccharide heptosyltransferase II